MHTYLYLHAIRHKCIGYVIILAFIYNGQLRRYILPFFILLLILYAYYHLAALLVTIT